MKKEKKQKRMEIREKHYTTQWVAITSIMMFFIAFYGAYFVAHLELNLAFVKSCFVLIVANIMLKTLVWVWNIFISKNEWLLIVHGPPDVDSRSQLIIREKERLERENERIAKTIQVETSGKDHSDEFVLG